VKGVLHGASAAGRADAGDGHPNREEVPDGTDAGLALRCGVRPERHSAVATSDRAGHPRADQPGLGVAKRAADVIHTYLQLAGLFAALSLLSIGGGNAVLPEMHLQTVKGHHWMTDSQFADIFSISQTAPGPSILIVTLVGYGAGVTVGGVPGAIVGGLIATAAMLLPAASLMYVVTLFWQKAQKSKWRIAVEKGFAPLTVGLIMATSLVMSRAADHDWRAYTLTAICTAIFIFSKTNPLIVVFAAGVLGYFDIV
jgi:chromate transporter